MPLLISALLNLPNLFKSFKSSAPRRYRPLDIVLSDRSNPDLVRAETLAAVVLWKRQIAEDAAEVDAMNKAVNDAMVDVVDVYGHGDADNRLPRPKL